MTRNHQPTRHSMPRDSIEVILAFVERMRDTRTYGITAKRATIHWCSVARVVFRFRVAHLRERESNK